MDAETQRQFESALKLAHDSGDVEGALAIAKDMSSAMRAQGIQAAPRFNIPSMAESIAEEAGSRSKPAQALAGSGTAVRLGAQGLQGLVGQENPQVIAEQQALRGATPYTMGGNVAGNMAMMAPIPVRAAGAVANAVGRPGALLTGSRAGQVLDAAGTSAMVAGTTTPGNPWERMSAAAYGSAPVLGIGGAQAAGAGVRRATTRQGSQIKVGENVSRELGPERTQAMAEALRGASPDAQTLGVNPTSAMVTHDPVLQVLESGSRTKRSDLWQQVDRDNAAARWNAIRGQAGSPEELGAMRAGRDAATTPTRDQALASASFDVRQRMGDTTEVTRPVLARLEELATGEQRPNAAVQTLVKYVGKEFDQGVTPGQLYTVRKMLTDGIANAPTSELSQAARAARPQRMQIIADIDKALDELSSGKWSGYMDQYKGMSPPISSKAALQKIVDSLEKGLPAGEVPQSMGVSPAWKTVGNLRDRFGEKLFGSKVIDQLQPEDRRVLEALVTNLKSQADNMAAKGVLGSHTAPLLANAGRADTVTRRAVEGVAGHVPLGGMMASRLFDKFGRAAEEELAGLLQNPAALADALRRAGTAQSVATGTQKASAMAGGGIKEMR